MGKIMIPIPTSIDFYYTKTHLRSLTRGSIAPVGSTPGMGLGWGVGRGGLDINQVQGSHLEAWGL